MLSELAVEHLVRDSLEKARLHLLSHFVGESKFWGQPKFQWWEAGPYLLYRGTVNQVKDTDGAGARGSTGVPVYYRTT